MYVRRLAAMYVAMPTYEYSQEREGGGVGRRGEVADLN